MEVQNPIRSIRVGQGLSLRKAADKIGCHYQALYMTEHGMYMTVPPRILDWAVDTSDYIITQINIGYMLFRSEKQDIAKEKYSLEELNLECLGAPGDNPVRKLRSYLRLTQSAFCKDLCVPVALLYSAENGSLPKKLKNIFMDLGIPDLIIDEIVDRYEVLD